MAQLVVRHRSVIERWRAGEKVSSHNHPKITQDSIDWSRTKHIAGFAFFIFGPLATRWYLGLHRMLPQTTTSSLFGRVLLDQLLWTPAILTIFFCSTALMRYGPSAEGVEECRYRVTEVVPGTLWINWAVWFPIQLLNFYFVPRDRWIYVINACSVPWTGYLAYRNSTLSK